MIALVSWRIDRRILSSHPHTSWRVLASTSNTSNTRVWRVGGGINWLCTVWRLGGISWTSTTSHNTSATSVYRIGKVLLLFWSGKDWRLFTECDDTYLDQAH